MLRALALAALLGAAPRPAAAQRRAPDTGGAGVPAVPRAAAATLAPAAPRPPARPPEIPAASAPPAGAEAKPAAAPPRGQPAPARAWRARARAASGVAPGVLARAATRTQQARAAPPAGCELPPARREPGTRCPPAAGQIESLEMDWNAPASR